MLNDAESAVPDGEQPAVSQLSVQPQSGQELMRKAGVLLGAFNAHFREGKGQQTVPEGLIDKLAAVRSEVESVFGVPVIERIKPDDPDILYWYPPRVFAEAGAAVARVPALEPAPSIVLKLIDRRHQETLQDDPSLLRLWAHLLREFGPAGILRLQVSGDIHALLGAEVMNAVTEGQSPAEHIDQAYAEEVSHLMRGDTFGPLPADYPLACAKIRSQIGKVQLGTAADAGPALGYREEYVLRDSVIETVASLYTTRSGLDRVVSRLREPLIDSMLTGYQVDPAMREALINDVEFASVNRTPEATDALAALFRTHIDRRRRADQPDQGNRAKVMTLLRSAGDLTNDALLRRAIDWFWSAAARKSETADGEGETDAGVPHSEEMARDIATACTALIQAKQIKPGIDPDHPLTPAFRAQIRRGRLQPAINALINVDAPQAEMGQE